MRLEFSRAADEDLVQIYIYGATNFGIDQAERYHFSLQQTCETILAYPRLAHEHKEFTPPVRVHAHKSHIILYLSDNERVFIVRVIGNRQDWRAVLDET